MSVKYENLIDAIQKESMLFTYFLYSFILLVLGSSFERTDYNCSQIYSSNVQDLPKNQLLFIG